MLNTEKFFAVYKSNLEQLMGSNPNTPDSVKKLLDLNLQTAQAACDDASQLAQALTGAKNPQELLDLQNNLLKSVAEFQECKIPHLARNPDYPRALSVGGLIDQAEQWRDLLPAE